MKNALAKWFLHENCIVEMRFMKTGRANVITAFKRSLHERNEIRVKCKDDI
jgi:hypothetical protein